MVETAQAGQSGPACAPSAARADSESSSRRRDRNALALARRQRVAEDEIKTQPGKFTLAGDGVCVGRDSGSGVTADYPGNAPWRFTGGAIKRVAVDVSGDSYVDLEREAMAMLARE